MDVLPRQPQGDGERVMKMGASLWVHCSLDSNASVITHAKAAQVAGAFAPGHGLEIHATAPPPRKLGDTW